MSGSYTITQATFQHVVLEGTSYEVGRMQGDILKRDTRAVAFYTSFEVKPPEFGFADMREMQPSSNATAPA